MQLPFCLVARTDGMVTEGAVSTERIGREVLSLDRSRAATKVELVVSASVGIR